MTDTRSIAELFNEIIDDIPNSYLEHLIDEWIRDERDRRIIKRRTIDGICFEPLAEEFDLSVRQVKSIVYGGYHVIIRHVHNDD